MAHKDDVILCTGLGNADGPIVEPAPAGVFVLQIWGTWSSNTAKLQFSPDGGTTWLDRSSFTSTGQLGPLYLGRDMTIRMTNNGGSVNAILSRIPMG